MAVVNLRSFNPDLVETILSHFKEVDKISMALHCLSSLAYDADSVDDVALLLGYLSSDLIALVNKMESTTGELTS